MECPRCKADNPDNAVYCKKCGMIVYGFVPLDSPALAAPRQQIVRTIRGRDSSDVIFPEWWAFIPLILFAISIAISIAIALLSISSFSIGFMGNSPTTVMTQYLPFYAVEIGYSMTYSVILGYLAYKLVSRENNHYLREKRLKKAMVDFFDRAAGSPERKNQLSREISNLSLSYEDEPKRRNPLLWAMVFIVPSAVSNIYSLATFGALYNWSYSDPMDFASIMGILMISMLILLMAVIFLILEFYMFHFLGKTLKEHETKWHAFVYNSNLLLSKVGFPAQERMSATKIHSRDTIVYVICTIFTLGLFMLFWWYCLVKDPNEHLAQQQEFEGHLLKVLS